MLLLCLVASLGWAQEFRSTISGHVYDSGGAAVPGAKLQAINIANNDTSNATTDNTGAYTIPLLRPGTYKVTAQANGFKMYNREGVILEVAKSVGIDVTLEVGQLTEVINVTAEAATLETQSASRVGVVNQMQVSELPLNARNPFMLGTMMSGVVFRGAAIWQRPFDNGAIAQWSVNGGRESNNEFMIDGAPNNAQAGGNNIAYVPIVDAVQEFSVQQNSYDASYGKTGGGIFNVILKSGTPQFHGTGYEFLRRPFLDANTFQSNAIPNLGKQNRANHLLDQYGFQLEGPVYIPKLLTKESKVKLFYLGSFENYRENTPNPLTNSFPEQEMRTGDFSKLRTAGNSPQPITIYDPFNFTNDANGNPVRVPFADNRIPANRISPIAQAVTKFMPLPNTATRSGLQYSTSNFLLPNYVNHDRYYNLILKFDWSFGDKHKAFFRHMSNDRTEDRAVNGIDNATGTDGQQPFQRINDGYGIDWVSTLTPHLVMNLRGSFNRFIEKGLGRANTGFDLTSLGLPASVVNQLPQPRFFGLWQNSGYSNLGRYQGINLTNNYAVMGSMTQIVGPHTLKYGVDLRRIHYLQQNTGNILQFAGDRGFTQRLFNQGEANAGDAYASFLLGIVNGSSNYPLFPFNRQWYFAPYFQDDWKVNRRLTLQLGLRWDYNGPPDEKWNRLNRGFDATVAAPFANQIPAASIAQFPNLANLKGGFQFAGVGGNPTKASNLDLNNWQPRVGMAYTLNEKTVLRGGYGLYYLNPTNSYLQTAGFSTSTPIINSNDGQRVPLNNVLGNPYPTGIALPPGASQGAATFAGRNNDWFDGNNFRTPRVHQFSFGLQRQISKSSTLEATYVGSRSVGLNDARAFNIPTLDVRKTCNIQDGGLPSFCDANVTNPFKGLAAFNGTGYYTADAISRYNASRPYAQFTGDLNRQGVNGGFTWYNSIQMNYNQRVANNLMLLTNYTFSKTVERSGWNDPFNNVRQQGLYFNDRPHFFKLTAVYQLPFGKGQKFGSGTSGFTSKLISGWEATTFYTNSSGEPSNLPGNVIQLKDPSVQPDWKANQVRGFKACTERWLNNGATTRINCAAGEDPYWIMLAGYAPRQAPFRSGQIRRHHAFTTDASLNKKTQITERIAVQFRAEAFNLFNHNYFGLTDQFNQDPTSPNFGTVFPALVSNQNSFPRQVQLGFKVLW